MLDYVTKQNDLAFLPSASVIIPTLHSPMLDQVIEALRRQTVRPLEVIIVGQDRYGFAQNDGWVRFFPTLHPVAPALASNLAIAYARGEVLCFIDSDCIAAPDWLETLLRYQAKGMHAVGGGIGLQQQSFWQRCDNIACMGSFLVTAPAGQRPYLITANLALHRSLIREFGAFDESFQRASGEDTDLTFRLRAAGVPLHFAPDALVYHHTNRSNAEAAWKHMRTYALEWPRLAARYRDILPFSLWQALYRYVPMFALLLVPLVALRDVLATYRIQPALWKNAWWAFVGVWWARLGWYAGLISVLKQLDERR